MGKNKPVRNAFFFYMVEFRDKQPRRFQNMREVAEAAGPFWERLSKEQKRPYEERAKTTKYEQRIVKYTSSGQDIEVVQRRENEKLVKEQRMKDNIEATIKVAVETGRIADQMFYVIHVNYFCYYNTDKRYYPAEIAVTRFTLRHGVLQDNTFHMITKPGSLPLGYSSAAKLTSEETHQLPVPLGDGDENNMTQVLQGLLKFMTELSSDKFDVPPVYAEMKNREIVENVLKFLCLDFGHDEDLFQVYSLEYLLYCLRNGISEKQVWPALSMSTLEIEKDKYDFCKEIPCAYHENSDVPNYCSRSHVIRIAYIICENCCEDVGIDLIPGQHVPQRAKISQSRCSSRASSVTPSSFSMSSVENQAASRRHRRFHDDDEYYLSARESDVLSETSETSTLMDPGDFPALGGYGGDTTSQEDEWQQPKQRLKKQGNRYAAAAAACARNNVSSRTSSALQYATASELNSKTQEHRNEGADLSQSSTASKPLSDLHFESVSENGGSQPIDRRVRRPITLSQGITGGMSQLSMISSPGSSGSAPRVSKGRGHGLASSYRK